VPPEKVEAGALGGASGPGFDPQSEQVNREPTEKGIDPQRTEPALVPLASAFDEDRFDALKMFAAKGGSLWLSIDEASIRADFEALELHCQQLRIITLAAFATVKALDFPINQPARLTAAAPTRSPP